MKNSLRWSDKTVSARQRNVPIGNVPVREMTTAENRRNAPARDIIVNPAFPARYL